MRFTPGRPTEILLTTFAVVFDAGFASRVTKLCSDPSPMPCNASVPQRARNLFPLAFESGPDCGRVASPLPVGCTRGKSRKTLMELPAMPKAQDQSEISMRIGCLPGTVDRLALAGKLRRCRAVKSKGPQWFGVRRRGRSECDASRVRRTFRFKYEKPC